MCLCVTTEPEDSSHFQQEYEHQNQYECYRDELVTSSVVIFAALRTIPYLCTLTIVAMIRSIPNPPMDRDDVARFRGNLEKHLRRDFSADERHRLEERKARTEAITKRITANCGGKNPILGY